MTSTFRFVFNANFLNSAITSSFRTRLEEILSSNIEGGISQDTGRKERRPTETLDRWLQSFDEPVHKELPTEEENTAHAHLEPNEVKDDEEFSFPELEEYRKIICTNPGYNWILERLSREIALYSGERQFSIRQTILRSLPGTRHTSRHKPPPEVEVTFLISWDVRAFIRDQCYTEPGADAIARAITLTGSCTDAQALTTRQYLHQTWPSTGPHTLQLIQGLLRIPGDNITLTSKP
jgi:hypothetical protein